MTSLIATAPDQRSRDYPAPGSSAQPMTTATAYNPGKWIVVSCTVAGAGVFTFVDGSTMTVSFAVGCYCYPWSCTTYTASTGTMSVTSLS